MSLSYQSKLAKAFKDYQEQAQHFQIKMSGSEIKTVLISQVSDKYGNQQNTILTSQNITAIFEFPNDEIPTSFSSTQDTSLTSSAQTIHLYDIIPIQCYISNNDIRDFNVTKGSIIFYPIKMIDGNIDLTFFQVTDAVVKGNPNYSILWTAFTVAPITDFALRNDESFLNIVNTYIQSLSDF